MVHFSPPELKKVKNMVWWKQVSKEDKINCKWKYQMQKKKKKIIVAIVNMYRESKWNQVPWGNTCKTKLQPLYILQKRATTIVNNVSFPHLAGTCVRTPTCTSHRATKTSRSNQSQPRPLENAPGPAWWVHVRAARPPAAPPAAVARTTAARSTTPPVAATSSCGRRPIRMSAGARPSSVSVWRRAGPHDAEGAGLVTQFTLECLLKNHLIGCVGNVSQGIFSGTI